MNFSLYRKFLYLGMFDSLGHLRIKPKWQMFLIVRIKGIEYLL